MRAGWLILPVFMALSACGDDSYLMRLPIFPAPMSVTVASMGIKVAGPRGFCVAPGASDLGAESPVVVMGRCSALRGFGPPRNGPSAMLTVTISPDRNPAPVIAPAGAQLDEFFGSDAGREAMARGGDPAGVTVSSLGMFDGAYLIRAHDTPPRSVYGLSDDYWRGLLDLKGHIVTITVAGLAAHPITLDEGDSLLVDFTMSLRTANEEPLPPAGRGTFAGFLQSLNPLRTDQAQSSATSGG